MIRFVKAHACGNDFLIVDGPFEASEYAAMARALCDRHAGIGADGVEYLTLGDNGSYAIRLFNADGSEAEISGNGTRCVAAYLAHEESLQTISIRTHAGLRRCRILTDDHPRYQISTEMGVPQIAEKTLQLADGIAVAGFVVSIGNPHFVIFTEDAAFGCHGRRWQQIGEEVCVHPAFPDGTNVEFVRVMDTDRIAFRIYERGVGPTQSSGTGSSASAAAAIHEHGLARHLTVLAEGGEQVVEWSTNKAELLLTGPAEIIAQGEYLLL